MSSGIYIITNTINNKCYIGSSVNIEKRWSGKYNKHLTAAFNKYGKENFIFEILANCNPIKVDLLYFEQKCINIFKPEYNICKIAGSNLGCKWNLSQETKEKMSIAKQQMSIKTKNKMSISHTGKLKSKETIAKMSKPKTQEHKAKISEAVYKRWNKVV